MSKSATSIIRPKYPTSLVGSCIYQKPLNAYIHRLTNSQWSFKPDVWTPGTILGGYTSNSEPYWSNCDDTKLLVSYSKVVNGSRRDVVVLYGRSMGSLTQLVELPKGIAMYDCRWSAVNNRHLYHLTKMAIERYDVVAMIKHRWAFDFNIGLAGGEGDVADTNEILLDKDGKTLFIYDLSKMSVVSGSYSPSTFNLGSLGAKGNAQGVDYATLSQDGNYILLSYSGQFGSHSGIEVYDRKWNYLYRIYPGVIHWITAIDSDKRPVIYTTLPFGFPDFMEQYKDRGYKPGDFVKIYIDTGVIVKLLDMPKWTHFMVARRRFHPESIYVSFEERELPSSIKTLWLQPDWSFGFGELLEINTNGGGFKRLCHTWCRPSKVTKKPAKWWQPDNFVFGNMAGFRSCIVNDDIPEMRSCIGDLFYVNLG